MPQFQTSELNSNWDTQQPTIAEEKHNSKRKQHKHIDTQILTNTQAEYNIYLNNIIVRIFGIVRGKHRISLLTKQLRWQIHLGWRQNT